MHYGAQRCQYSTTRIGATQDSVGALSALPLCVPPLPMPLLQRAREQCGRPDAPTHGCMGTSQRRGAGAAAAWGQHQCAHSPGPARAAVQGLAHLRGRDNTAAHGSSAWPCRDLQDFSEDLCECGVVTLKPPALHTECAASKLWHNGTHTHAEATFTLSWSLWSCARMHSPARGPQRAACTAKGFCPSARCPSMCFLPVSTVVRARA